MNIIKTAAPIKIDDLKKYFENKDTCFEIDYASSTIKGDKLLTYISNLDIPCDIKLNDTSEIQEMMSFYLDSIFIVNLPSLEKLTISLLLENKGLKEVSDPEILAFLKPRLDAWTEKLDSLPLFNMYIIQDQTMKQWVIDEHQEDDTMDLKGINFVSLLKYEDFYYSYQRITEKPRYYSKLFNDYMFKGQNLYSFWANENNPMFLLTHAIASDNLNLKEYVDCVERTNKEMV